MIIKSISGRAFWAFYFCSLLGAYYLEKFMISMEPIVIIWVILFPFGAFLGSLQYAIAYLFFITFSITAAVLYSRQLSSALKSGIGFLYLFLGVIIYGIGYYFFRETYTGNIPFGRYGGGEDIVPAMNCVFLFFPIFWFFVFRPRNNKVDE